MTQRADASGGNETACSSDSVAGYLFLIFGLLQMGILVLVIAVHWGDSEVLSPSSLLPKLLVYTGATVSGLVLIRRTVSVDPKGITLGWALAPSTRIEWSDVRELRVAPRTLYDEVMDTPADASWELLLSRGERVVVSFRRLPSGLFPAAFQMLLDGVPRDSFVGNASLEDDVTDGDLATREAEANAPSLVAVVACTALFYFLQLVALIWLLDNCVFPFCWLPGVLYSLPSPILCYLFVFPILGDISSGKTKRLRDLAATRLRWHTRPAT